MIKGDWFSRIKSYDTFLHGHVRSDDKLKTLNTFFRKFYGRQNFKSWGLEWRASGYNVILPYDSDKDSDLILQDSETTKLGWEETYSETWCDPVMPSTSDRFPASASCYV